MADEFFFNEIYGSNVAAYKTLIWFGSYDDVGHGINLPQNNSSSRKEGER